MPSAPRSTASKVLLVVAGVGCAGAVLVILLGFAAVAGGWTWLSRSVDAPIEAATTTFLNDVRDGHMEAALARTSEEYRQTHTLEVFRATMNATPALITQTEVDVDSVHQIDGIEEVRGTLETPNGRVPFYIELFWREVTEIWIDGRKVP